MPAKNNPRTSLRMHDGRPVYKGHYIRIPSHWRRLLALWVDCFVMLLIFSSVLLETWGGPDTFLYQWTTNLITAWICFMLINGWPLLKEGQTLGKKMFKLRVVDVNIRPAHWAQLTLLRYGLFLSYMILPGFCIVVFLFDSLFIFRPSRRSLHDILSGTVVLQILEPAEAATTEIDTAPPPQR